MSNKIYYKVVKDNDGVLLNKDLHYEQSLRTEYKLGEWTHARDNSRLFVFDYGNESMARISKSLTYKVFKCVIGSKIHGNGLDYGSNCSEYIDNLLGINYLSTPDYLKIKMDWFWNNVEKNLKNKKKYCTGMEHLLFPFKNVVLTNKVKLLEEI